MSTRYTSAASWHVAPPRLRKQPVDKIAWISDPVEQDDQSSMCEGFEPTDFEEEEKETDVFKWVNLPNELKSNIIEFCISTRTTYADAFHHLQGRPALSRRPRQGRTCELIQRLGPWKSLIRVSVQVRAITLNLCFIGSIYFPKGFCISSWTPKDLCRRFNQLDKYKQVAGLVIQTDYQSTTHQAHLYRKYPAVYPELSRFATFKHGIRKVFIKFDFFSYMHFFKVSTGGFDQWLDARNFTCDIFSQLPHLNEVVIALPTGDDTKLEDLPGQPGPPLWDALFPCPGTVIRVIYERVAIEMAPYENITVLNFLNDEEEQRFQDLRQSARLALKFTPNELLALYADTEGGIQLDEGEMVSQSAFSDSSTSDLVDYKPSLFWPPRCVCLYSCFNKFRGIKDQQDEA